MAGQEQLIPVSGCWVQDPAGHRGMVVEREGARVQLRYGTRQHTWIDASQLRSAFAPGMQVEHRPVGRAADSQGIGEVKAIRQIAGC
jgi:hypothetical protein